MPALNIKPPESNPTEIPTKLPIHHILRVILHKNKREHIEIPATVKHTYPNIRIIMLIIKPSIIDNIRYKIHVRFPKNRILTIALLTVINVIKWVFQKLQSKIKPYSRTFKCLY